MVSWGFIEVTGYTPAVAAMDVMIKTADVEFAGMEALGNAMVTVGIKGDIAAVRTAIDAGVETAKKQGEFHSSHIVARPKEGTQKVLKMNMK